MQDNNGLILPGSCSKDKEERKEKAISILRSQLYNYASFASSGEPSALSLREIGRFTGISFSTVRRLNQRIKGEIEEMTDDRSSVAGHGPVNCPSQPSATSSLQPASAAGSLLLGKARQPPERQVRALSTKLGLNVLNPSAPHCAVPLRFGADFFRRC
jgi:hypothetical protein